MPQWSIVLPVHSSAGTVGFAIESALAQTDADFELLVVGDGCDSETRAVIETFLDPRIQFVDNPKAEGFGYAHRRAAIERATSEYIAFLSDDDLWGPDHLADLGALLGAGHAFAYSRPLWCVPSGRLVPFSFDLNDPTVAQRFTRLNYIPSVCCAATRRSIVAAGGWPVDVVATADWYLWRRILGLPGSSVGVSGNASALHFRAGWRDFDHLGVAAILDTPGLEDWWPSTSTVDQASWESLQAAIANRANSEWWRELNGASASIIDHLALAGADLAVQLANARTEIAALRSSTSWRVTRPLRAMRGRSTQDRR
jgi:glycosyltransferase involved in cell wall biosynthesis